jgi:hypothetical protein
MRTMTLWGEVFEVVEITSEKITVKRPDETKTHKASLWTLSDKEKEDLKDIERERNGNGKGTHKIQL